MPGLQSLSKLPTQAQLLQLTTNSPLPCGTLQMRWFTALPVDASGQAPSAGAASEDRAWVEALATFPPPVDRETWTSFASGTPA